MELNQPIEIEQVRVNYVVQCNIIKSNEKKECCNKSHVDDRKGIGGVVWKEGTWRSK